MRRGYWIALGLVLVLALGVFAAACGGETTTTTKGTTATTVGPATTVAPESTTTTVADTSPLKFGVAISLTGASAAPCGQIKEGFETEAKYVNANNGINGRPVELVFIDDQSSMTGATAAIQSLVDQQVDVIFGPFPQFNQAATRPIAEEAGILQITFGPPVLAELNGTDTSYTYCFDPATGPDGCADAFLKEMLADGRKNVLCFGDQMTISQETLQVLSKSLPAAGIAATVMSDSYGLGEMDMNSIANKVQAKFHEVKPDAIIICSNPEPVNVLEKALHALGVNVPMYNQASAAHPVVLFAPAGNDPANVAGDFTIGAAIVGPDQIPDSYPAKQDLIAFVARWKADYPNEPFQSFFIGFAYDSFHQAEQAILTAETQDEAGWAAALAKLDWWGAQGHYVFSETDHVGGHGGMMQWQYTPEGFKFVRDLNAIDEALSQETIDAVASFK
jgi:ABC-type branched-subunit amino acid transport system substrate-binding protein